MNNPPNQNSSENQNIDLINQGNQQNNQIHNLDTQIQKNYAYFNNPVCQNENAGNYQIMKTPSPKHRKCLIKTDLLKCKENLHLFTNEFIPPPPPNKDIWCPEIILEKTKQKAKRVIPFNKSPPKIKKIKKCKLEKNLDREHNLAKENDSNFEEFRKIVRNMTKNAEIKKAKVKLISAINKGGFEFKPMEIEKK